MSLSYTTIGGFPLMVAKALDAYGIDGEDALARCGIDPQIVKVPDTRVPIGKISQLLQLAVSETGDPAIGLKAGTFIGPTTFHALTMSMWLSPSLKDAFDRAVRYEQLLSDAGRSGMTQREQEYCYWTEMASADREFVELVGFAALDTLYSAMVTFCRIVYGESFSPIRVSLMRDKPEDIAPYLDFFRCPVDFSQPLLSLSFDKETMEKPLPSGLPELLEHSDHVIIKCLSRFDRQDIVGNLRAKLLESLPSGKPSQQHMASALHLSLRSLQRKLSERGLTYDKVLGEVRRDLAQKYILQPHLSISEISYLLGFSSSTNFSRNFKSWMGDTPREYRHKHVQATTPQ
jgi:AraC-like DNA-binding protein